MAQQLKSINVVAPGFQGINTEDSPLALGPSFAAIADNAVIDRFGRLAARKGYSVLTTTATELNNEELKMVHEFRDELGNTEIFSAGNNKILSGTGTLTDETPASYTIADDNWQAVNFNDSAYFFQQGQEPLVYSNSLGAVTKFSSVSGYAYPASRTDLEGGAVLAAYGRLWVADFADDKSTVYWSDLLDGVDFNGGSSGSIDLSDVWPTGYDEVQGMAAHNNLLVIFGKSSIVVYGGADSPSTMSLVDTVVGIGCIDKNTILNIGTDLLFLSAEGLRSFGRAIQEKALPITDLSKNIKQDILEAIVTESSPLRAVYSPENNFVLLTFPTSGLTYCFDIRGTLENGAYRVTRWPTMPFKSYHRKQDGTLLVGTTAGIGEYAGYDDNGSSYRFKYFSSNLTFGDVTVLKIMKKIQPTVIGGEGANLILRWSYDFTGVFSTVQKQILSGSDPALFGIAEFNEGEEFTGGTISSRLSINTTGNGFSVSVGMEVAINGDPLSLQEFNVITLIGKMV